MIREYLKNPSPGDLERIMDLVKDTENEHDGAGDIIKEMRKITEQYTLPKDACPTYCLTYEKLIEMESDIFQHIHLENNILFPRLKTLA
jgi:regulator of cell morphogenesis and NO signaling